MCVDLIYDVKTCDWSLCKLESCGKTSRDCSVDAKHFFNVILCLPLHFMFRNLADNVIQSDLRCIPGIAGGIYGNKTHNLWVANTIPTELEEPKSRFHMFYYID